MTIDWTGLTWAGPRAWAWLAGCLPVVHVSSSRHVSMVMAKETHRPFHLTLSELVQKGLGFVIAFLPRSKYLSFNFMAAVIICEVGRRW